MLVQAFANALGPARRHESLRLAGRKAPLVPRLVQVRSVSSKPDKPDENEDEDGKENGEHAAQPPAGTETSESTPETKRQPLFSPLGGRGRSGNGGGSSSGLPPVNLPPWFLDEHVQILNSKSSTSEKVWDRLSQYIQPSRSTTNPVEELEGIWASEPAEGQPDPPERAIGRELVSTISAELNATAPLMRATKEPKKRPISLLYVYNYKGSRIANVIIGHVGAELEADVIHLDAAKFSRLVGPYLGSTLYFGRGNISMLGYAAAEANGRSASGAASAAEGDDDFVMRGMSVMKFLQPADDRATWDDLKLTHVLKEIVNSADIKRKAKGVEPVKPKCVMIHIHNYVELTMTSEGTSLLNKLRTVVDRQWQDGTKIIIVGSASNDANASIKWHAKVRELSEQDCYPIVFSPKAEDLPELKAWEQDDYVQENLLNINWMLDCLRAESVRVVLPPKDSDLASSDAVKGLISSLSSRICSNHWVYRLCTQAIGLQRYKDGPVDTLTLADALRHMSRVDQARSSILGIETSLGPESATVSQPQSSPIEALISLGNDSPESSSGRRKTAKISNLDDEEKKLLPGLVNVADIHTTFDDVIAPPHVRDSLVSLTTLSLQHPKAFSYGVLARERIHGALLYGPPGTGKTLMAKALAKGSGANMLEISAASINDMWVGNVRILLSQFKGPLRGILML